jgi:predicted O-methyltransferase YrrM
MTLTGNSAAKDSAVCRRWRMAGVRSQHTNFERPIGAYVLRQRREPEVLAELRAATSKVPHNVMQIGADQGALMALLVKLIGAKRCIELGTYTGYSALAVALALPTDGTVSRARTRDARRAARGG